jgi:predicted RNase H-like nuclease
VELSRAAHPSGPTGSDGVFVGIDLAWSAKADTGLAAVDGSGRLIDSAAVVTDDEIASWIDHQPAPVVVAAVDAPLVVPNETGQRVAENQVAKAYGRYGASPYPSNRSNPLFDPPRAATLADRFGWTTDPDHRGTVGSPACIEVYPHPAMVGLFSLPSRILYKKGPTRAAGFAALVRHFETVPQLRLTENQRWLALRRIVAAPRPGDLTRIEDEIDAILCAHLGWLWHQRPEALQVYGSLAEGYIVAPPPPTHAAKW